MLQRNTIDSMFNNAMQTIGSVRPPTMESNYRNNTYGLMSTEDNTYTWYFMVPGIKKEDTNVFVENDTLRIEATAHVPFQSNINYRLRLPKDVDPEDVKSSMKDGVLYVTAAKKDERKRIPIQLE